VSFPQPLCDLIDEFVALPWELKLEYLADYAERLPQPTAAAVADGAFETVPECQSPLAFHVNVGADDTVTLAFQVSPHAVTANGYVGLLYAGLNGVPRVAIMAINTDIPAALGLTGQLSQQRLIGLRAVLFRVQLRLATYSPNADLRL